MLHDLSLRELHILTILFYLLAYFDEQSVSTKSLIECQLISQNSEREILLCCRQWIIVTVDWKKLRWRRHRRKLKNFVLKMKSSRIVNDLVSFYSLIACNDSECEVYIVRHDENQILCHESCLNQYVAKTRIFDLKSKYVHEDRMSKIEVCVKFTLVLTWIFADKIRLNRNFSQDMLVTIWSSTSIENVAL